MPGLQFFRNAGLFLVPDFFPAEMVTELCRMLAEAPTEKASVELSGREYLDEVTRKTESGILPKDVRAPVKERLLSLLPQLEEHFRVKLSGCESPQYLIYRPGDYFIRHCDGGAGSVHPPMRRRRVSAVIFLNGESAEPARGAFGQGRLTFYGLLKGQPWENCAFALQAEPGLLVAFPSELFHEVTPISHGERFSVVTWFCSPESD